MDIKTKYIKTTRTARYATWGNLSAHTKYFWFALHGSHMRSDQMLFKFDQFDPEIHFIIAPEGLNKQYLKNFSGEVVASWMTKRDRLFEIEDFSNYLSMLYEHYANKLPEDCTKIAFGFSQGGTSLFRWLHCKNVRFDHLLAYSSWIPEDIDLKSSLSKLSELNMTYIYGLSDQYLSKSRVEALKQVIDNNELIIDILDYEGDHRVDKEQLINWFDKNVK